MKTAKRVLAIALAVMLVLGTVPFAASAFDFTDGQKVSFRLKAQVFDADGAQEIADLGREAAYSSTKPTTAQKKNQTADFKAFADEGYDDYDTHEYNEARGDGYIHVQPGQIIWVTLGYKSEGKLYPCAFESIISYTDLFLGITNTSKANIDNSAAVIIDTYAGGSTINSWALQNDKNRNKFIQANGDHGMYVSIDTDAGAMDGAMEEDLDEDMVTVPIYVKPNAVDGATGTIYMADNFTSSYYNYVLGYEDGDVATDCFEIAGEYLDYTDAVLNFKVGLYLDDLEDAMDEFEGLKEADWTADTWADAAAAYADAEDVLADEDATQEDIDAAAEALAAAIDALEKGQVAPVLDYTRINAALDASDNANTANATTSTKAAFDDALAAALDAVSNATTQEDLDAAAADLEDAIDGLKDKADMTAINEAIAYANGLDKADMSDESIDDLNDAVAAAQAILAQADDFSDQAAVADAAQAIYDVRIMFEVANYTEVWDLMDEAALKNEADYTTASWADLQTALGAVVPGLGKSQQATVDGFAADISEALDGLKEKIDTAGLAAALSIADGENKEDYTTQDWMQLQVYVNTAKNDYIGKEANYASDDKQAEVDQLANDIYDILAKKLGDADYSAVEAALAKIPEDDILAGVYTEESVAVLDEIAESLVWGLKEDKQDQVDKMAQDLEDAIAGLTLKKADYDMVDKYLAQAAGIDRDLYTAASLDVLDAAVRAVVKDLDITHQDEVTGMANDLYAALEGLEYAGADFSAIDEIAENAGDLAREFYTDDSLAAYDAAVADAIAIYNNKAAYTIADQAEINAAAAKGADAESLLVAKDADFTEIDKLVADALALDPSIYTEDSWAAFDTAFDGTLYIYNNKANYDIFDQGHIDVKAEDGAAAFDLLVLADADYSMVDKWYNKVADTDADLYTTATWAAYAQAKDDTVFGLKADKQDDVDAMADALYQAQKNLVLAGPADYTAVNAAIADFNAKDADLYTEDSVKAVEDAIADVTTGLNENHQDEVDAMADAINDAIGKLEEKQITPPTPATSKVVAVEYTDTAERAKEYSFKVDGRAWKIQIVDENGDTITFSRVDTPECITSYNEAGEVVNNMDRDLAYEIWNVNLTIKDGDYTARARYTDTGWEAVEDGLKFTVASAEGAIKAEALEIDGDTFARYTQIPVTVKTGKDVLKVAILDNGVEFMTFDKSAATAEGDQLVFNAYVKLYSKGDHTITAKVKTASGWQETDLSKTVTAQ